jgi:protein-disulfide isomerase
VLWKGCGYGGKQSAKYPLGPGRALSRIERIGRLCHKTAGTSEERRVSNKGIVYGVLALVAIVAIGAIAYFTLLPHTADTLAGGGESVKIALKPTDRIHGKANAPITIIEFASLTCPHCAAFERETLPKLTKNYIDTGKVRMVFRDYPLDGAARLASALARCVPEDNYYSFIDLLFLNQDKWWGKFFQGGNQQVTKEAVEDSLAEMARFVGMGHDQAVMCMEDPKNLAVVDANYMEAQSKYMVDSTPTFFVNGVIHKGEWPYEQMDAYLKKLAK